jgi:hypothetical protein
MGERGIDSQENIIPRVSGQTSLWSFRARRFDEPTQVSWQMTPETTETSVSDPSVGAVARLLWSTTGRVGSKLVSRCARNRALIPAESQTLPPVGMGAAESPYLKVERLRVDQSMAKDRENEGSSKSTGFPEQS